MAESMTDDFVYRVRADIDNSMTAAVDVMGQVGDKALEMASDISDAAGEISSFSSQVSVAVQQLERLKNQKQSFRQQVLIFTGVFSAATFGIYKFAKQVAEAEMNLIQMQKKQKKTVETIRASDNALKAMGKTMADVKADKELKKTYDELVKINAEMALPNMTAAVDNIKGLRNAFWELRSTAKYAIDWIGARVLTNLAEPIKRITDKLGEVAKWLRNNLDSVTMKISSHITAFVKGIEGIVEGFVHIMESVNQLDPAIRQIGSAILFIYGLIKSGPIGQLLTLITAIGGIIDDMENFKWNQQQGITGDVASWIYDNQNNAFDETGHLTEEAKAHIKKNFGDDIKGMNLDDVVAVAFPGIWDIFWGSGEGMSQQDQIDSVFTTLFGALDKKLAELETTLKEFDPWKALFGEDGATNGGIVGGMLAALEKQEIKDQVTTVIERILNIAIAGFGAGGKLVTSLAGLLVSMFDTSNGELTQAIDQKLKGNTAAEGLGSALLAKLLGFGDLGAMGVGIMTMLENAEIKAADRLIERGIYKNNENYSQELNKEIANSLGIDFGNVAELLMGGLSTAIEGLSGIGSMIFTAIGNAIIGDNNNGNGSTWQNLFGTLFQTLGEPDNAAGELLSTIVSGWAIWGPTGGLFAGIADGIKIASEDGGLQRLAESFDEIWNGALEEITDFDERGNKIKAKVRTGKGLKDNLLDLLFGPEVVDAEKGSVRNGGILQTIASILGNLWDVIRPVLDSLWRNISQAVEEWWNGKADDKNDKGFQQKLKDLLGIEGDGSIWDELVNAVTGKFNELFSTLEELAGKAGSAVWTAFFNSLPDNIQNAIRAFTNDPNSSHAKTDEKGNLVVTDEGQYIIESTTGESKTMTPEQYEAVKDLLPYMKLYKDDNGDLKWKSSGALTGDTGLDYLLSYINGDLWDAGGLLSRWQDLQANENLNSLLRKIGIESDAVTDISQATGKWDSEEPDDLYGNHDWEFEGPEYSDGTAISGDAGMSDVLPKGKGREKPTKGLVGSHDERYGAPIYNSDSEQAITPEMDPEQANETLEEIQETYDETKQTIEGDPVEPLLDIDKAKDLIDEVKEYWEEAGNDIEDLEPELRLKNEPAMDAIKQAVEAANAANPIIHISGDASGAIGAAASAVSTINSMHATISVSASVSMPSLGGLFGGGSGGSGGGSGGSGGGGGGKGAFGGRFDQEKNNMTIGEDGTEYLIPITKPSRAAQLIKQMFNEMGTSAVSQIIGDLGLGMGAGTIGGSIGGGSYGSIADAIGGGMNVTNNNNVSAPCTIYVTASGVGAEDVGERAYDAAQRHMLRTLKGVFA